MQILKCVDNCYTGVPCFPLITWQQFFTNKENTTIVEIGYFSKQFERITASSLETWDGWMLADLHNANMAINTVLISVLSPPSPAQPPSFPPRSIRVPPSSGQPHLHHLQYILQFARKSFQFGCLYNIVTSLNHIIEKPLKWNMEGWQTTESTIGKVCRIWSFYCNKF